MQLRHVFSWVVPHPAYIDFQAPEATLRPGALKERELTILWALLAFHLIRPRRDYVFLILAQAGRKLHVQKLPEEDNRLRSSLPEEKASNLMGFSRQRMPVEIQSYISQLLCRALRLNVSKRIKQVIQLRTG